MSGELGGATDERLADLEVKLQELRRVNAELGRELRRGGASRQPRSPATAARALAKLSNERDTALARLEKLEAELAEARAEAEEAKTRLAEAEHSFEGLRLSFEGLKLEAERLRHEAARLRSGKTGLLRRLRARLLRR